MTIRLSFATSGTTGEPKEVVHTLDAMEANARAFNEAVGLGPHTVMYHCLPKAHMAGFLNTILCPTLAGGRVVFGPTFSAQSALTFWSDLLASGANTVWITPTVAVMLLRLARGRTGHPVFLANVFCGTAPLPARVRKDWLDTFAIPLQESYGTSEHMLVSVQSKEDALLEHNAGRVLPGVVVEIGDNGEILVDGASTGDQGELHGDMLTITGRLKDLIIRGGFNVSPNQVEEIIRKLPSVDDVAVVGEPDEFWGERIVVFAEGPCSKAIIAGHCRDSLPKSHQPDRIEIVDRLPRNEMGKVQKKDLARKIAA